MDIQNLINSLVAYYKMDDNADDTVVIDSMGNHNGVSVRNTSLMQTTGINGGGLDFSVSNNDWVDCGYNFLFLFQGQFTIAFWFKPVIADPPAYTYPLCGCEDDISANIVAVWMENDVGQDEEFALDFFNVSTGGGGGPALVYYNPPITTGNWYFVCAVQDATKKYLYLNGTLLGSQNGQIAPGMNGLNNFHIGNQAQASNGQVNATYDNFMIFSKALSQDEISYLYNNGNGIDLTAIYPSFIQIGGADKQIGGAITQIGT